MKVAGWLAVVVMCVAACPAYATDVGGTIGVDTTWTLAGSPYIAVNGVLVSAGVTLTIEPGVVVKLNPQLGLQINGCLVARGTAESPIVLTSNQATPAPGDWDYILFPDSSTDATFDPVTHEYTGGCILEYCEISCGGGSAAVGMIQIDRSSPFINRCTIEKAASRGINIIGTTPSPVIRGNTIRGNYLSSGDGAGISANFSSGWPVIEDNTVDGNSAFTYPGAFLRVSGSGHATIRDNVFRRNICRSSSNYPALLVYGWTGTTAMQATGNVVHGNEAAGIGALYATVSGNIISSNLGCGYNGYASDASHNTIIGNKLLPASSRGDDASAVVVGYSSSFTHNTVADNFSSNPAATDGVYTYDSSTSQKLPLSSNNILGNDGYQVYNYTPHGNADVLATGGWWGTADPAVIPGLIYDWFDDSTKGVVDFSSYLSGPITSPPLNQPVICPAIPDLTLDINTSAEIRTLAEINLKAHEWDIAEGDETLTWSLTGGDPELIDVQFDPVAETLSVTPLPEALGSTTLWLTLEDGEGLSFTQDVVVNVVAPPTLTEGDVSPDTGPSGGSFTWSVVYTDLDNDPPSYIRVHIDGSVSGNAMTKVDPSDTNYTDGCLYQYQRIMGSGTHTYHFETGDGLHAVRLPEAGELTGPYVCSGTRTLTLQPVPPEGGSVDGGGTYSCCTPRIIAATPNPGWEFTGWSGDFTGTENPSEVVLCDNMTVYASFYHRFFEDNDPAIQYTTSPPWTTLNDPRCSAGHLKRASQTGARADFPFTGTGITWWVGKGPAMGKAKVYLDGRLAKVVDLYSASLGLKPLPKTGLAAGPHTLGIEVSGQKNTRSTGYMVTIDRFEVIP